MKCVFSRFPNLRWFVPSGVKSWFESSGIPGDHVSEMVWWQESEVPNGKFEDEDQPKTKVVFTPSNHWSRRSASDENHCLWGSFAVVGKKVKTKIIFNFRTHFDKF
jgi:N-acyl-phosphatidylethanolamine-hydrolysing phospholipase D